MHYAVIAAGDGSRLVTEGVSCPKPLLSLCGEPMIGRLLGIFASCGAESISVIVNEGMLEVQDYLRKWGKEENLRRLGVGKFNLVVESTPSSMHSFYRLSKVIDAERVCLTTVDTVFKQEDFSEFISRSGDADAVFAVTPFIDDEKPLYVEVDGSRILGFHDEGNYPLVSGGIYVLDTSKAFPILADCIARGEARMRNFQRALIKSGLKIEAHVFPKILDIDHADDIRKAERFLKAN